MPRRDTLASAYQRRQDSKPGVGSEDEGWLEGLKGDKGKEPMTGIPGQEVCMPFGIDQVPSDTPTPLDILIAAEEGANGDDDVAVDLGEVLSRDLATKNDL